jgi:tRNA-specific 2-thiouridylase
VIALRDLNWLADQPERFGCEVKLRAREAPHPALVRRTEGGAEVELDTPALAAPGQACVMYRGARMLGGGFITAQAGTRLSH